MVCIYCGAKTSVSNSRPQKRLQQVWRRRVCSRCNAVFTTIEHADMASSLRVHYPDGSLHPFDRYHLFVSIHAALGHRTDSLSAATALLDTITAQLLKHVKTARIGRQDVIATTLLALQRFDSVAGVYYQARHRI